MYVFHMCNVSDSMTGLDFALGRKKTHRARNVLRLRAEAESSDEGQKMVHPRIYRLHLDSNKTRNALSLKR